MILTPYLGTTQRNNLSTPIIQNFSTEDYLAGTHNWNIASAHQRIYFANNNGLLEYNGNDWRLHRLPNESIMRSVEVDERGRIYVGGQDEIGYYFPGKNGELVFHSIRQDIPEEHRSLEDVWDIMAVDEKIFALSINKVFIFDSTKVDVFDPLQTVNFMSEVDGTIFFNLINEGLYQYENGEIDFVENSDFFIDVPVTGIEKLNNDLLVCTTSDGIYIQKEDGFTPWNINTNNYLRSYEIISTERLNKEQLAIGTALGGVIILGGKGEPVYLLDKDSGLQNNNVASLFSDSSGNLWAGTYNGIDLVLINDDQKLIFPDGSLKGAIYDIAIHNEKIYFGTNNGLYYCDWKSYYNPLSFEDFELVKNSSGQVWGLDTLGRSLLMGHNEGAFVIQDNEAIKISPSPGYWKFLGFRNNSYMIAGGYTGLSVFKKSRTGWTFVRQIEGFGESCRIMEKENDNRLWVSHPYRGIYRVDISDNLVNATVKKYTDKDGFPSILKNHVFKINEEIVFTGETNVYKFKSDSDRFEIDSVFTQLLSPGKTVNRLFEGTNKTIWFITEDDFGYIQVSDDLLSKNIVKTSYPDLSNEFVAGFENIHILQDKNVLLLTDKGVIDFKDKSPLKKSKIGVKISRVIVHGEKDSVIFGGYFSDEDKILQSQPEEFMIKLAPYQNALRFEFFNTPFELTSQIQYSSSLGKADVSGNVWTDVSYKEYTNLSPGIYTFLVKARNSAGEESDYSQIEFTIMPPWYQTNLAYSVYGVLVFFFIVSLILVPSSKYKKKAKVLEVAQEKSQEEIIQLKNENLQTQINFKNQQLASSTMHIVQKNEVLNKIKEEIESMKKIIKDPDIKKELKKLVSLLSNDERLDADWESFAYHFDQVHTDFLRRIKGEYPNLSPKDQKLCAYLRMNLSTKEIAPLLNISVRGVEISRYRLRKKMNLDSTINLNEFMMKY